MAYLSGLRERGVLVLAGHSQHVLHAVVELGEAEEVAVAEIDGRLVHAVERARCARTHRLVQQWTHLLAALAEVTYTSHTSSMKAVSTILMSDLRDR